MRQIVFEMIDQDPHAIFAKILENSMFKRQKAVFNTQLLLSNSFNLLKKLEGESCAVCGKACSFKGQDHPCQCLKCGQTVHKKCASLKNFRCKKCHFCFVFVPKFMVIMSGEDQIIPAPYKNFLGQQQFEIVGLVQQLDRDAILTVQIAMITTSKTQIPALVKNQLGFRQYSAQAFESFDLMMELRDQGMPFGEIDQMILQMDPAVGEQVRQMMADQQEDLEADGVGDELDRLAQQLHQRLGDLPAGILGDEQALLNQLLD